MRLVPCIADFWFLFTSAHLPPITSIQNVDSHHDFPRILQLLSTDQDYERKGRHPKTVYSCDAGIVLPWGDFKHARSLDYVREAMYLAAVYHGCRHWSSETFGEEDSLWKTRYCLWLILAFYR